MRARKAKDIPNNYFTSLYLDTIKAGQTGFISLLVAWLLTKGTVVLLDTNLSWSRSGLRGVMVRVRRRRLKQISDW